MDEESILLSIEFNSDDIKANIKNIADARKQIDNLLESNKKLAAQGEKNSTAYIQNEQAIKALNTEVANSTKVIQANSQAVKANEDNLKALKAENKQLLKDRDLVNHKTAEGRAEIEKINAKYDENSKIIAANSTQVEKQRFNIGNYISGLSGVSPVLGQINNNSKAMVGGLQSIGAGFKRATTSATLFTLVPIIAVLTAIIGGFKLLSTFLTGSTKGMDLLEDATAAVSTVMEIVTDRVVKFVGGIAKLVSGDFSAGLDEIQDSFSGIGDEIEREINLTLDLNKAIRELEDAEINYDISASKTSNTIKELLLQAKNRTLSEKERIALLEKASALEKSQNDQLIKNKQEALRLANEEANKRVEIARIAGETEAEFGQRLLDTGLLLDDQRDKVKDSIIAFNGALGESISVQEKIQNQQDALAEKAEADRQKRADAEKKRLDENAAKQEEIRQRNVTAENELEILKLQREARVIQGAENQADKLIEIEQVKAEQLLANQDLTEQERQLIVFNSEEAINQILLDSQDKQKAEQQAMLAQSLEDYKVYVQGLIDEKKRELLEGKITREEFNQEMEDVELASLEVQQAIKEQFGEQDIALQNKITDHKIASGQKEVDTKKLQEQAKIDVVRNALGTIANAFNKQSVAYKVLASAQTLIDTIRGSFNVFTGMTDTIPGPVGIILGLAAAAATTASGLAAVAKINSTPLPKLAEGGVIDIEGKRHSQGGEKVSIGGRAVAEVEQGESMVVLKRGASPLLKTLGRINAMVGGRDFYSDRAPRYYNADGGFVARSAASRSTSSIDSAIANLSADIAKMRLEVSVTEINKVNSNVNRANVTSELS